MTKAEVFELCNEVSDGFGLDKSPVFSGPVNPPVFGNLTSKKETGAISGNDSDSTPYLEDIENVLSDIFLLGEEESLDLQLPDAVSALENDFKQQPDLAPTFNSNAFRTPTNHLSKNFPPTSLITPTFIKEEINHIKYETTRKEPVFLQNHCVTPGRQSSRKRQKCASSFQALLNPNEDPAMTADKMRKQRNKEHAKRSRVRKKFLLDSLQQSIEVLEKENQKLREVISNSLGPEVAKELLYSSQPYTTQLIANDPTQGKVLEDPDYSLVTALQTTQRSFILTDPSLPDNPIVFASPAFLEMTGYTMDQVLGRNCRFLQGPNTNPKTVAEIRRAIAEGEDCSVRILNYRVDGTTFWNNFYVAALRDIDGKIVNFIGVQCEFGEDSSNSLNTEKPTGLA